MKRFPRNQWPDHNETWRDYMARENPVPVVALCLMALGLLMLVLAEAIDQGLA